ncbi:MAG: type II toxin-antitoxin system HigB family toxin [Bryobacteraceae bacterium]
MRLLGRDRVAKHQRKHPATRPGLNHWLSAVEGAQWRSFPELKVTFRSADYVDPVVVFNVGGNKCRIVALVDFEAQLVQIDQVMTHREYDRWSKRRQ